jgi:hypothetical protein
MMWFIYNTDENMYIGKDGQSFVDDVDEAIGFYSKYEAIEMLRDTGKVTCLEDEWRYNLIKSIPCRGCEKHETSDMRYDAYNIETGHWCNPCYDSDKYPYRKDKYDYQANGESLDPEDGDISSYYTEENGYDW